MKEEIVIYGSLVIVFVVGMIVVWKKIHELADEYDKKEEEFFSQFISVDLSKHLERKSLPKIFVAFVKLHLRYKSPYFQDTKDLQKWLDDNFELFVQNFIACFPEGEVSVDEVKKFYKKSFKIIFAGLWRTYESIMIKQTIHMN